MLDHPVEGAGRAERADVQLVDRRAVQLDAGPVAVGPAVPGGVEQRAGGVHPVRLPPAARIGQRIVVVHLERVPAVAHLGQLRPPAVGVPAQLDHPAAVGVQVHPDAFGGRCPDGVAVQVGLVARVLHQQGDR